MDNKLKMLKKKDFWKFYHKKMKIIWDGYT